MIDRRQFLRAALFVAASPIIVRASSLMKVVSRRKTIEEILAERMAVAEAAMNDAITEALWLNGAKITYDQSRGLQTYLVNPKYATRKAILSGLITMMPT